jgi:cytochrome c-type biogenesis protein CcmH
MSALRPWLAIALALACACEKKTTPSVPPPSGIPPLGVAPPSDRPVHEPTAQAPSGLPAGHPSLPPGHPAMGGDEAATPGDIPFDPKTVIAGSLKLDDKVKAKVQSGDVIFLVARAAAGGPPLAVKRMVAGAWPLAFTLDSRDAMMAGTAMQGKVIVNARIDKDGDAMTKNPGDVTGVTKPVEPPAKDVVLMLDTVL